MPDRTKPGVKAARALQRAERWRKKKLIDPVIDPVWNRHEAAHARAEAEELMRPPERMLRGGNEVVRAVEPGEVLAPARNAMLGTLEEPNMISVEASEQRMEEALAAGVLQAALDAAVSANAANSLENMLCHQMAAAHHAAMTFLARASDQRLPPVEQVRLGNAARADDASVPRGLVDPAEVPEWGQADGRRPVRSGHRRRPSGGRGHVGAGLAEGESTQEWLMLFMNRDVVG